jgi:hypothetical protein
MMHLFFFELKRLFKQKKTWIIMGILCILSVFLVNDFNSRSKVFDDYLIISVQSQKVRFDDKMTRLDTTIETGMYYTSKIDVSNVREYRESVKLLLESLDRQEEAVINQDWEAYHKEELFYDYWIASNYVSDITYLRNQKIIEESTEIIQLQTEVKEQMNYPDLVFSSYYGITNVAKDFNYFYKNHLLYSYQTVQNEIFTIPVHRYTMSGSTFIYHFFAQFWFYIFVLQILLGFNEVEDSRNFGTNKLVYTLPYKRPTITLTKLFISAFSTIIVILFPLVLISIILFLQDGFSQLNLPVLINSISWKSFTGIENNLKHDVMSIGGNLSLGISYFSSYPKGSYEMHELLDFIKLREFYGLTFILFFFNVTFLSSIILMISQIIRQKMLALIAIVTIFGLGVYLTFIDPNALISKFNPFGGFDMILLNGGSSSLTLLNIILVLIIFIFLVLLSMKFSKHRD